MDPPFPFDPPHLEDSVDPNILYNFDQYYSDSTDAGWLDLLDHDQNGVVLPQTEQSQGPFQSLPFSSDAPPLPSVGTSPLPLPQESPVNVSQWLEGSYRPSVPCDHCRKYRLQCLIIRTTEANPNPTMACSSCVALFRECSLARGEKRHPSQFETQFPVLGHLHGLPEIEDGNNTPELSFDSANNKERKDSKHFVRKGARILREWFYQHQEYPYPTEEQKSQLSQETGFSQRRISTWFANARRRQKQQIRSSTFPSVSRFRSGSPMITSTLSTMTPLDRWRASPPEDEPVSQSVIQNAIASAAMETDAPSDIIPMDGSIEDLFDFDEASSHLASSASSFGSRASETSDSISSAWSHHSAGDGELPFPLLPKRTRPQRRRPRRLPAEEDGRYQCTFCTRTFKKKHDWSRHEKSVHLPLDSWICAQDLSHIQRLMQSELRECPFCEIPSPPPTHWEEHDFHTCAAKPVAERSFSRRDHLWQHLRKFHGCTKSPVPDLDAWRGMGADIQSRCGFCKCTLPTWTSRVDHLAEHFKDGSRMPQWEGDWGLDPIALSMLRNAVLPSQRSLTNS